MHPACCLPLWGREGVTLVNQKNVRRQTGFSPAAINVKRIRDTYER